MPVLRSREISPANPNQSLKPDTTTIAEPLTPAELDPLGLGSGGRRSSHFAPEGKRLLANSLAEQAVSLADAESVRREDGKDEKTISLGSGKIVDPKLKTGTDAVPLDVNGDMDIASEMLNMETGNEELFGSLADSNNSALPGRIGAEVLDNGLTSDEFGTVPKNKRKLSWVEHVKDEVIELDDVVELNQGQRSEDTGTGVKTRRYWQEGEQMEMGVIDELLSDSNAEPYVAHLLDIVGVKLSGKEPMVSSGFSDLMDRRAAPSTEDKGKNKVFEYDTLSDFSDSLDLDLGLRVGTANDEDEYLSFINLAGDSSVHVVKEERNVLASNSGPVLEDARNDVTNARERVKERFRNFAKKNASRFAHFSPQEQEDDHVDVQPVNEMIRMEADREVKDWPGPFSTAMKILRDRESDMPMEQQSCASNKSETGSIKWTSEKEKFPECSLRCVPKLQDLCIDILAKNAHAICSLESVPDVIRHKLSHMLCDSRKMDARFLGLLVCGSPTEIRIKDCSWLTEEEFTRAFQSCDASLLTVLQLDQCGRCLPDYLLSETLARAPNALPILTALSIKGACRLSDAGLKALLASAPALRSINLSQCSLLTCNGINTLADRLGSILRELYMDDCEDLDPLLMLPALLKLEQLEILSLAGIQSISDDFIKELVAVRGRNFKELVLTDCMKLTDSSLKAIAETCTDLHALDLSNLHRLTDSTLGYLANGCRTIRRLKLSRNAFSDEAIAAYLEASGGSLIELSLNNIRKVGDDTALSLARRSRNLLTLDLSWCRNLTDQALGLIVDSCLYLKVLKLFGCTQITNVFVNGHSNPHLQIIGLKSTPILKNLITSEPQLGPLQYSAVF